MAFILKTGDSNKRPWYMLGPITCNMCSCEFGLENGDNYSVWGGNQGDGISTHCPYCHEYTEYFKEVSKNVKTE